LMLQGVRTQSRVCSVMCQLQAGLVRALGSSKLEVAVGSLVPGRLQRPGDVFGKLLSQRFMTEYVTMVARSQDARCHEAEQPHRGLQTKRQCNAVLFEPLYDACELLRIDLGAHRCDQSRKRPHIVWQSLELAAEQPVHERQRRDTVEDFGL